MIANTSQIIPYVPTADHTGKEGYFVVASSTSVALVSAVTDIPLGVITDGADTNGSDAVATPGFAGTVKVKVGSSPGTINLGTVLTLKADGTVKADAGSGERVKVAVALESGSATELIEARLIQPVLVGNAVTLGNANSEISGLTIGGTYSQAEVQALQAKCEELADDVRALYAALQTAGVLA